MISTTTTLRGRSRSWIIGAIILVLAFDLAFFWQRHGGAYKSEFGGHPDEAAHVVTGLFVRDAFVEAFRYVVDGCPGSPLARGKEFADDYYAHYPKIGLGVWPPVFYLVQAGWTLGFGTSRASLLLLMCVVAAILGVILFRALRDEFEMYAAAAGVVTLLSLPLVREQYAMVMTETLSALVMFSAALLWGRFLDRERGTDAIWFGVVASLAILTKGTGLALGFAAPLALVLSKKLHLLKRRELWLAVVIVVVLAGPWTWATRHFGKGGWVEPHLSWSFTSKAVPYYLGKMCVALGATFLGLFAVGAFSKMRWGKPRSGRWLSAGALIVAILVFQSGVPVGLEARHLIPALPAAIMFSVAGMTVLVRRVSRVGNVPLTSGILLVVAAMMAFGPMASDSFRKTKGCSGFGSLAEIVIEETAPLDVILVSSDATGEGMFIAEVALRERRPGHLIQRASKALAHSSWSGGEYAPTFESDAELLKFLTGKIEYLVMDEAGLGEKRRPHHDHLRRVVENHPEAFKLLAESELMRAGRSLVPTAKLYQVVRKN